MGQFRQILIPLSMLMFILIPTRSMAQGVWELVDAVPTTTTLNGVWGSSPTNVIAVGYSGKIVHFDGNSWSEMSSGTSNTLKDIWGSSENDLFAVGSNGTILHYDGNVWSSMASGTYFHFEGVWGSSANDVFAVANYGFDNRIFHYDGVSWTEMASGYPGTLYRFWGSAGDNVFLVGTSGQILHYDGLAWSTMASGTSQNLYGIWGSDANNVFAVGYDFTILQFDGMHWTKVASTNHATLRGIGGGSGIDVHAVGNTGTLQYYDGTNWASMSSPTTSSLTDVWAASKNLAFAVGSSGTILRYSDNDSTPFDMQFDVTATKVDTLRSKAYFTDKDAQRLYVVDLVTGVTEKYFEFNYMPERMTMSPDGRKLYVALLVQEHSSYWWKEDQSGFIAVLDLDQQAWVDTLSINTDPYDLVVTSSGKLVVASGSGQWTHIYAYDVQTGAVLGQATIRQQSRLSLHPSENWVFAADTDSSPSDIEKFDITGPGIVSSGDSPYHGDYRMNGDVWATPDGQYLITRGGDVFRASDMTYVSSITNAGIYIEAVSFDEVENIGLLSLSSNGVLIINLSSLETIDQLTFSDTVLGAYAFGGNGYYIIDSLTGTGITKEPHPCPGCGVANRVPTVEITSPSNMSTFSVDDGPIVLAATAIDPEDGDISNAVVWSSDLDGAIVSPAILSVGTHLLTASVTDLGGLSASAQIYVDISAGLPIITGVVPGVNSNNWTTVPLPKHFSSMVVVCSPVYDNTSPPLVVRIQNAQDDHFQLKVDRADGKTGRVNDIPVHYLVVEEGVYSESEDGVKMEAARINATQIDYHNSWLGHQVSYTNRYVNPVVIGQVMTYNDPRFSVFWSRGASRSQPPSDTEIWVGRHVGEDTDLLRNDEMIGYVVIESGNGTIGALNYAAGVGSDTVKGIPSGSNPAYSYLVPALASTSSAIISQTAMDGANGGWAILYGDDHLSASELVMAIDEDQLKDTERDHTNEQVAYVVFEATTNMRPVAYDDEYVSIKDQMLAVPAPGILVNDADEIPTAMTGNLISTTSNGSLTLFPDGSFEYIPDVGFVGSDSFSYQVNDGVYDSNVATVSLSVSPPFVDRMDLVMELHLDEPGGTSAADTSEDGQSNNGILRNGASFDTNGAINGAVIFDGVDDHISISDSADINTAEHDKRSIGLWFNVSDADLPGQKQVIYEEGGATRGLNIYIFEGALYAGGWNTAESGWVGTFLSTDQISSGYWHHVTLILDGEATVQPDRFKIYLDGNLIKTGEGSKLWAHSDDIGIGALNGGTRFHDSTASGSGTQGFSGAIDEVLIYNRLLTDAEINILSGP